MNVLHISDTHENHRLLTVPEDVELVIFSGDEANSRDPYLNEPKARDFFEWFKDLDIKYKIFVAGNHSSAIAKGLITRKEIENMGIHFLENEEITIEHLRIWGSPFSPSYGSWWFQKPRNTINRLWENIPEGIDILITHSPPKGVLDLTYHGTKLENVGCSALAKRVYKVKPRVHCFGHIHDNEGLYNSGFANIAHYGSTMFSNGACVTDGKFGKITSHGNLFRL